MVSEPVVFGVSGGGVDQRPSLVSFVPGALPLSGYRRTQVAHWLYQTGVGSIERMTNLPGELRNELSAAYRLSEFRETHGFQSADGSVKYLFTLNDGQQTEAVYMPYEGRTTICISSMVGCPAGCSFCATGYMGFSRNLSAAEIVDQLLVAAREWGHSPREIRNVVLMGMGEPLLNLNNVLAAIRRLLDPSALDMSPRRITLSTVGIPHGIYRLAEEDLGVKLALSLHAPDEETRKKIIPTAHRYGLAEIMEAVRHYYARTRRRVTLEYTMLENVNDHPWQARMLGGMVQGLTAHVNLIPFNAWRGAPVRGSGQEQIRAFAEVLKGTGIDVSVRWSRGRDVGAACGQLAAGRADR